MSGSPQILLHEGVGEGEEEEEKEVRKVFTVLFYREPMRNLRLKGLYLNDRILPLLPDCFLEVLDYMGHDPGVCSNLCRVSLQE